MKVVTATEAKNRLGALIADVASGSEDVVIENHGTPRAALISYETYRELLDARERQRRRTAIDELWQLREDVRARNEDLDAESADRLIDEAVDAVRTRRGEERRQSTGRSG